MFIPIKKLEKNSIEFENIEFNSKKRNSIPKFRIQFEKVEFCWKIWKKTEKIKTLGELFIDKNQKGKI